MGKAHNMCYAQMGKATLDKCSKVEAYVEAAQHETHVVAFAETRLLPHESMGSLINGLETAGATPPPLASGSPAGGAWLGWRTHAAFRSVKWGDFRYHGSFRSLTFRFLTNKHWAAPIMVGSFYSVAGLL